MEDCIFCKIVKGEIPATKIYEDKHLLAFLDIMPINPGHVLVIPKTHFESFTETPDEILKELISVAKKIAPAVMTATGAPAFNLTLNNGKESGQVVPHVHFHIIPRLPNDGYELWQGGGYKDEEEKNHIAASIKDALK